MLSKIIQSSYVELMNCIYNRITRKIPVSTREKLILVIFVVLAVYFIVFRSRDIYPTLLNEQDLCQFFGGCLLIIAAFLSMRGEITTVPWRNSLTVPYLLFALGLVGIGLMHPIGGGYGFFGLMLLSVYLCLYLVWNNRGDYETLFDMIALAFMLAGTVYFIWFVYADYKGIETVWESVYAGRHEGGLYNANFLSFLGLGVSCCALYYFYRSVTKIGKKSFLAIGYGLAAIVMGSVLIVKGGSRAAILVLFANAAIIVFFLVKRVLIASGKGRISKVPLIIIGCIILLAILVVGSKYNLLFAFRFDFSNQNADQFSSGRIGIWKNYAQHLTLLGHDMSSVNWDALTGGMNTRHAHNNFLDYSYRSGVAVGLCLIAFQLIAGIITLVCMFKRKMNRGYEVFVVIFTVQYLIFSLVDIATLPMTNYGAFFFFICVAPLFTTTCIEEEEKRDSSRNMI